MIEEFLSLANLSKASIIYIYKLIKVIVVGKYKNFVFLVL